MSRPSLFCPFFKLLLDIYMDPSPVDVSVSVLLIPLCTTLGQILLFLIHVLLPIYL